MTVPMPGHFVKGEEQEKETIEIVDSLEKLVE